MTKLNWELFKPKFGTWADKIKPFFEEGGFDPIYEELKRPHKTRVVPDSVDVFKALRETRIDETRVLVMGYCPYHSMKDDVCVADGLMSSCSKTGILQPSLEMLYGAWEEEFNDGLCLECHRNPDLSYLAHQGVLLFNSALTTLAGVAGAHQELWEEFTRYFLQEIVGQMDIPIILLGAQAREFFGCFHPTQHVFSLSHPASASYKKEKWSSEGVFKRVNEILGEKKIEWLTKESSYY